MPYAESDEALANTFADYFMKKISKIRDEVQGHPEYSPEHRNTDQLVQFHPCLCRVHLEGNKTNGHQVMQAGPSTNYIT